MLTPLALLLCLGAVQAALWNHSRTEVRVIARDAAASVGRGGVSVSAAQASAASMLQTQLDLHAPTVTVSDDDGVVSVTVTGMAPGILYGTWREIVVTESIVDENAVLGLDARADDAFDLSRDGARS